MTYDYLSLNFASISGFIFLLIFLHANASLDTKIKRIFYLLILIEFVEMLTYSLELWTTTFVTLSPLRLWLSAIGYSVRPFIFLLMLMLAMRNSTVQKFPKPVILPAILNIIAAFSVFFTDIVYSYTADNLFIRGPLGYTTYVVVIFYLILLIVAVVRNHAGMPKLETLIIFAITLLLLFSMAVEALFAIRTVGRAAIIMVTIFYYMFFQTQVHKASITQEQLMRQQLEHASRIDGSTGVLNKKAFTEAAKNLLQPQNTRQYCGIGFVFLDLDHLKALNDTLGHSIGDIAISEAADTIRNVFRHTDLVGRFGGDEFYILLPDIQKQHLQILLNEAQARLQKDYTSNNSTVVVTASIGAVYTEHALPDYEQFVHMADEALYEAKASGRNCHILREV